MRLPNRTIVLVDAANYHYALTNRGWRIDWQRFVEFCSKRFGECSFFYYEGTPSKTHYFDRNPGRSIEDFQKRKKRKQDYFRNLRCWGFVVRTKPIHSVYDASLGAKRHKCNFDVELTIDAIVNLESCGRIVLCSGDSDFDRLLRFCKSRGRRTTLIADSKRIHWGLAKTANQTIYLEDLREEIAER